AGQSIHHDQIGALLGKGGMGEVYQARDTRLERTVALKVLPSDLAMDADRMRRFVREAKAASALNHPHVATIYEIGEADSVHFIAMEYVEGQTLAAKINGAPLLLADLVAIGSQIADALDEAHGKGITHRDIKPANVMLNERGQVKVLDFGLAKVAHSELLPKADDSETTTPGLVLGTVSYMSPEQALGRDVDHRSDLFSLGVVLYEMATGRLPFAGANTVETLDRLLHAEPEGFDANAPAELEPIVRKCLAKEPAARYQSAADLLADLQAFATGRQSQAETERQRDSETARRAPMRYSSVGVLAVCTLLLLLVVLGWRALSSFRNISDATRRAVPALQLRRFTASGNVVTAALSPDVKYVATALEEGGLQSLWLKQAAANASGVRLIAPAAVEYWGLTFSHDSNFIYYLSWVRNQSDPELNQLPVLGGTPRRLPLNRLDTPVSLAPTGDRLTYAISSPSRRESYVMVAPVNGERGEILAKRAEPGFMASYPGGPAWSPDGQVIAYAATGQMEGDRRPMHVFVVNAADKSERQLSKQSWAQAGRVTWMNDGTGLVVSARGDGEGPRQLWFVAWPDGTTHKITNDLHDYDGVSLSADGQTLAAVQTQNTFTIAVATAANLSQPTDIYAEVSHGNERHVWTPDQRLLYNSRVSGNWDIWVMNKDGSGPQQLTVDPHNDTMPTVSADGRTVYFTSDRTGTANLWRMAIDGSGATRLSNDADQFFPEITPDSQWLFFQHGAPPNANTIWRLPLAGGAPLRVSAQTMAERQATRPAISPDGQWLAYVSLDENGWGVILRAMNSGQVVKRFNFPSNIGPRDVRWMHDGQGLAYVVLEKGVANLWVQPLNGAPPSALTHFKTGRFSVFAWSPDGKWLAYQRQAATSDVILLRDFK
ncbi:MAG: serine/threonine-protein kinase, partial [Acidobacteria bacterium]|nr:serine/threonine-protein kinase [Acidobacteriota bacterium]